MTDDIHSKLEQLLTELEDDLQLCTTRDQHIRVAQRIGALQLILLYTGTKLETAALDV